MENSSSSRQGDVTIHVVKEPRKENEENKDHLIFDILVKRGIVLFDTQQRRIFRTFYSISSRRIFTFEQESFLSCREYCKRHVTRNMIKRPDIPFSLEKIHWLGPNPNSSDDLESIVTRLLDAARDCAQHKSSMLITIDETHALNPSEYYKAPQILDDWLLDCKNDVNEIHCTKDYPLVSMDNRWNVEKGMVRNEIWNEEQEECCSICMNELRKGTNVIRMSSCSHVFHVSCILRWFHIKPTCPLCRSELFQECREVCLLHESFQTGEES